LNQLGITSVIDATNIPSNPQYQGIEYLRTPLDDDVISNITQYFVKVADFVESTRSKGGKTLIFCAAGISRSAALCMMSLVINEKMTLRDSFYEIHQKRPFISPNIGFWRQMIDFEETQNGKSSVRLLRGMRRPLPDVYVNKPQTNSSVKSTS
uniref:Protein-tyrosine-phosphatase n=1 Tax=Anisakis simplex TaxID=6269 RepID=A0A0M3KH80_ANISI